MRKPKTFSEITYRYFYPEIKRCPFCGQPLKVLPGLYIKKTIQTLAGVVWVGGYASHCINSACHHPEVHYRSNRLASLSLPNVTYGLDVIVRVGWRRQHDHRTIGEIGEELRGLQIQITNREVERLWDYYRILLKGLSQQDRAELRAAAKIYGGLIWAVDGLEPESGQPQLWVVREVLSEKVVHAEWLRQVDESTLKEFLRPVKALRFKTLATVSDQQPALVKALKATWHKPHQACQSHFLRDAAKPLVERDRAQMVEMKAKIRGIRALERQVETAATGDRRAGIVATYLLALRQGLRLRSRAPLHLGGLLFYALLDDLVKSLQRCLKKGGTSGWPTCWTWFGRYAISTGNPCISSLKGNGG